MLKNTSKGKVVTESDIDSLVEEAEAGYRNATQCAAATPLACRAREGGGEETLGGEARIVEIGLLA